MICPLKLRVMMKSSARYLMLMPLPANGLSSFVRKLRGILQRLSPKRNYAGNLSVCGAVRSLNRIEENINNNARRVVNDLLHASKQAHYHAKIKDNSHNQTFLFSTINKLLQKSTNRLYPSSTDDGTLANAFADFYAEKISKIRTAILETKSNLSVNFLAPVPCSARFSSFNEVDCSAVHRLLSSLSKKSCSLDPVPACVLMDAAILHCLFFTEIINLSLTHGVMPDSLKTAILSPLLKKKKNADHEIFTNFSPNIELEVHLQAY